MKADNFRGEMEDAIKGAIELSEGKTTEVNLVKEDNNLNKKHHKKEKQTKSECRTNEENINDCSAKLVRKDYGVGRSLHSVDLPHEKNTDAESRLHGMEGLDVNEKTGEGGNMVKTASNPRGGSKKKRKKNRKFNACAFCRQGDEATEKVGKLCLVDGKFTVHELCARFSPNVLVFDQVSKYERQGMLPTKLHKTIMKEVNRGRKLSCNVCRKKGATYGCGNDACRKSFHIACAVKGNCAADHTWPEMGWTFFCSRHTPKDGGTTSVECLRNILLGKRTVPMAHRVSPIISLPRKQKNRSPPSPSFATCSDAALPPAPSLLPYIRSSQEREDMTLEEEIKLIGKRVIVIHSDKNEGKIGRVLQWSRSGRLKVQFESVSEDGRRRKVAFFPNCLRALEEEGEEWRSVVDDGDDDDNDRRKKMDVKSTTETKENHRITTKKVGNDDKSNTDVDQPSQVSKMGSSSSSNTTTGCCLYDDDDYDASENDDNDNDDGNAAADASVEVTNNDSKKASINEKCNDVNDKAGLSAADGEGERRGVRVERSTIYEKASREITILDDEGDDFDNNSEKRENNDDVIILKSVVNSVATNMASSSHRQVASERKRRGGVIRRTVGTTKRRKYIATCSFSSTTPAVVVDVEMKPNEQHSSSSSNATNSTTILTVTNTATSISSSRSSSRSMFSNDRKEMMVSSLIEKPKTTSKRTKKNNTTSSSIPMVMMMGAMGGKKNQNPNRRGPGGEESSGQKGGSKGDDDKLIMDEDGGTTTAAPANTTLMENTTNSSTSPRVATKEKARKGGYCCCCCCFYCCWWGFEQ
mmetsp:Transcript_8885/g.14420  ORF Transcript_8885/g.14420 Transcript_8885/m.14420 type:complete len:811 (-) Transcript_8885:730-3162(-)